MRLKTRLTGIFLLGMVSLFSACGTVDSDAEPHRILFLQIAPHKTALFVSNADGSDERPLLVASSRDYNPAWSRDDQALGQAADSFGRIEMDG